MWNTQAIILYIKVFLLLFKNTLSYYACALPINLVSEKCVFWKFYEKRSLFRDTLNIFIIENCEVYLSLKMNNVNLKNKRRSCYDIKNMLIKNKNKTVKVAILYNKSQEYPVIKLGNMMDVLNLNSMVDHLIQKWILSEDIKLQPFF